MATTNGNGRRKRTALNQLIENSKPLEKSQELEQPTTEQIHQSSADQNQQENRIDGSPSVTPASSGEAIAHPLEQPPGDSPDAQTPSDRASGLDSSRGAIAHPQEQKASDSTVAQAPSESTSGLDSSCAIAHPLEQVAEDKTSEAATEDTQQQAQATSPSPEEVLRAAKAASQKAQEQATESPSSEPSSSEAPQSSGAIEKTVSSELQQATSDAAKELVDANSQALQERVQIGVREGLEDAKDIRLGYQLGLLKGLTVVQVM